MSSKVCLKYLHYIVSQSLKWLNITLLSQSNFIVMCPSTFLNEKCKIKIILNNKSVLDFFKLFLNLICLMTSSRLCYWQVPFPTVRWITLLYAVADYKLSRNFLCETFEEIINLLNELNLWLSISRSTQTHFFLFINNSQTDKSANST